MNDPAESSYRRSSFCANVGCVEVAPLADGNVAVRDSRNPQEPLILTWLDWVAFKRGVKAGEFDDFAPGEEHTTS